jgi:hypothetical protein
VAGSRLLVQILGPKDCEDVFELSTDFVKIKESLFDERPRVTSGEEAAEATIDVLQKLEVVAPTDMDVTQIRVKFGRGERDSKEYLLTIDHGRYYLSVGLLVPFVANGSRTFVASPVPGTGQRAITLVEDWHLTAALALNVYPFGRRRGQVSAFTGWSTDRSDTVRDLLGFQIAADLDVSDLLDQWYFGLMVEPVAGVSLNAGMALLKGEFLPDRLSTGMLVGSDAEIEAVRHYMARPYIGFTLTLDIIDTLAKASREVRGVKYTP